jgi:hypothetical protein
VKRSIAYLLWTILALPLCAQTQKTTSKTVKKAPKPASTTQAEKPADSVTQPGPKPEVPETPKITVADVMKLNVITRFSVEEELLLEKVKENPRLTRNALVEMHEKRVEYFERQRQMFFRMAQDSASLSGDLSAACIANMKQEGRNKATVQQAIEALNKLVFN